MSYFNGTLGSIFEETEIKGELMDRETSQMVIDDLQKKLDMNIDLPSPNSCRQQIIFLRRWAKEHKDIAPIVYEKLKSQGYSLAEQEVQDIILQIGLMNNPKSKEEIYKQIELFPTIRDISYDQNGCVTIESQELGPINYYIATEFYKRTPLSTYIRVTGKRNWCHAYAQRLSDFLPDEEATVALCKGVFSQQFYHSYTSNKAESYITDVTKNAVIDEETFNKIYHPQPIISIPNSELSGIIESVYQKIGEEEKSAFLPLLNVALYQQYLHSAGNNGPINDGPKVKKLV